MGGTGNGFLEAYADGTTRPTASNVQFNTKTIAGMAIVPVGADGKIDIYDGGLSTSVNVVGDVAGYFTAGTAGEKYHAIAQTRLVDTRNNAKPVASDGTLAVAQGTTVVAPAPTLVLNVTAVDATAVGTLYVYPAGAARPLSSNLNDTAGVTVADLALAVTGGGGDIYNASSGTVQLVVDCQGYFSAG